MNRWWTSAPIHWALIGGLSLSAVFPPAALAEAEQAAAATAEAEVARVAVRLDQQQMLRGTVRDDEGRLAAGTGVVLGRGGKPLHRTETDQQGRFVIGPLTPGAYEIASPDAAAFLQVEAPTADPERSAAAVEVSRKAMIARGQDPRRTLLHGALIALVIAAAIAIPIAIAADDDDAS